MNQTQAIAKLRKLLGPKMAYRIDPKAPDAEQREVNRAAFQEAKCIADEAEAARVARLNEVLRADPLYQALKAKAKAATAAKETAGSGCYRKRITVGVDGGMFFSVRADGDNWADVVEKVMKG